MKTKCNLIMARSSNDVIDIQLTEENSRIQFLRGEMTLEDFAHIITGRGDIKFECELEGLDKVGRKMEAKREKVPTLGKIFIDDLRKIWPEVIKPFEVDGWKGDQYDFLNHHKSTGDGHCWVTFKRWV